MANITRIDKQVAANTEILPWSCRNCSEIVPQIPLSRQIRSWTGQKAQEPYKTGIYERFGKIVLKVP